MAEEHDRLFADLDALTEEQIQVGLAWRMERAGSPASPALLIEAVKSKTWAMVAVIIAAGGMLAAIAAAFVAFLALRNSSS